jgi:hypothetical protein
MNVDDANGFGQRFALEMRDARIHKYYGPNKGLTYKDLGEQEVERIITSFASLTTGDTIRSKRVETTTTEKVHTFIGEESPLLRQDVGIIIPNSWIEQTGFSLFQVTELVCKVFEKIAAENNMRFLPNTLHRSEDFLRDAYRFRGVLEDFPPVEIIPDRVVYEDIQDAPSAELFPTMEELASGFPPIEQV